MSVAGMGVAEETKNAEQGAEIMQLHAEIAGLQNLHSMHTAPLPCIMPALEQKSVSQLDSTVEWLNVGFWP